MWFYQLTLLVFSPIITLLLWRDSRRRQGGADYINQRLGIKYPQIKPQATWLHCASVGEVNAIAPLLKARPEQNWLITVNTPTGYRTAKKLKPTSLVYLPFDFPWAVKNFLEVAQPKELLVVETEIWPNLYKQTAKLNIPIKIINARLSQKTLNAPKWLKKLYKKALSRTEQILARTQEDKDAFIQLGADTKKIKVLGNIKYAAFAQHLPDHPKLEILTPPYLLLASSHADEELEVAKIWQEATQELGIDINLIIAPRHIERAEAIQQQLKENQLESEVISLNALYPPTCKILIINQFGKLLQLYQYADLVIIGGSFEPKGGQNFLEPAAYGKPIVVGKNTQDFAEETQLFKENNAIEICQDYAELKEKLKTLLIPPYLHKKSLGKNAQQTLKTQAEVLDKYLAELNL